MSDLRAEVAGWLAANWREGIETKTWLGTVVDGGWAVPTWPAEWYGRGLNTDDAKVIADEFRKVHAPGACQDAWNLWANTVQREAQDGLKHQVLRRLLMDDLPMCLLYSEPGAGSDLASIATRADRDGDEWVVNGQKVWTSGGRAAEYAFLIARTDWDQPKHRGISFFFLPMRQTGVEVRPLRQATGDARFNEVFITDARVPAANMLGDLNKGWWVLQTALMYERAVMGGPMGGARPKNDAATARDPESEANAPTPDLSLVELAQRVGKAGDPVVRQALARLHCLRSVNEWTGRRAAAQLAKDSTSPLASLGKLAMANILHVAGRLQVSLLGPEGTLAAASSAASGDANYSMHNAYFFSIGGGTDQIQRNIIGERILGLPKEPEVDRDLPFREIRRS
jgi:alkylation response protein AidB-like acyl-CoA dehydrogenase